MYVRFYGWFFAIIISLKMQEFSITYTPLHMHMQLHIKHVLVSNYEHMKLREYIQLDTKNYNRQQL
jgi:polyphosphate kinase